MAAKTKHHERNSRTAEGEAKTKSSSATDLRQNRMMAHLMEALEQGQDIVGNCGYGVVREGDTARRHPV